MNPIKKLIDKIKWTKNFKAKKGQPTCNSCRYYLDCSIYDVEGEYFAFGAKHDGAKICKYYEKKQEDVLNMKPILPEARPFDGIRFICGGSFAQIIGDIDKAKPCEVEEFFKKEDE